jgi:thioredoxin 1
MKINPFKAILVILAFSATYSCGIGANGKNVPAAGNELKIVNDMESFNEIINGDTPVLVDFYADWCAPCRMMGPIMQQVSKEMVGKVRVIKVDVDKNEDVARKYQIRSIPTMILFKKGKLMWQGVGVIQADQIKSIVQKNS